MKAFIKIFRFFPPETAHHLALLSLKILNKVKVLKLFFPTNKDFDNPKEYFNLKFRKKNKTTDVLSFPMKIKDKKRLYVGDIAISYEIIKERSKKTNFFLEFDKMWIHGYLHLIGHDHKKLNDFKKMFKKEKLILN